MIGSLAVLAGCATSPLAAKKDYSQFRNTNPRSILVVPVLNRSTTKGAPDYLLSTITRPIAERGYYVFPVNLVKYVLEEDGLADADLIHRSQTARLASMVGADSVLYISIDRWEPEPGISKAVITIELSYSLKSGSTGVVLWKHKETLTYDPAVNQSQVLLGKRNIDATEKAKPDYLPMVRQANENAINRIGQGLPAGPLHTRYRKDKLAF